jgi:hypothetical protein
MTYAELRRRVDELELDLLEIPAGGVDHERLADRDDTLLGTGDGALEHQEVVPDDAVVREATHRRNRLLRHIRLRRRVVIGGARTDTVDLLVELRTVMVAVCKNLLVHIPRGQ